MKTREEINAIKRAWNKANPEKVKAMSKRTREKHREQRKIDNRAWVEKNKERSTEYHKEYHKAWYEKNKGQRKVQMKEYAQNHRADSVKRVQKYVSNNREKVRQYNHDFGQTIGGKYRMVLHRAKKWGAPYLSLQEFAEISSRPCVYCGFSGKVGIDRVDNKLGYSKENSAPACTLCNFMKKAMNVKDFLAHVQKIHLHNSK